MCGILGIATVGSARPWETRVAEAINSLAHRGPDASGVKTFDRACLAHTRLSIIDLEGSEQPWISECGRYCISFNGEIYNYVELRSALSSRGYRFTSSGDTEVLLAMYMEYGVESLNQLNGMFAFAIWDEQENELLLARDRLGKKPLYYRLENGDILFSSELRALTQIIPSSTINQIAVEDFFAHQYVGRDRSIYQEIHKLLPAHYLKIKDGKSNVVRYWTPPEIAFSPSQSQTICEQLLDLTGDSIRLRLRSDVAVGAFLSGGIDSAVIVNALSEQGADVAAFTVGFEEKSFDESEQAKRLATDLGIKHQVLHADINTAELVSECLDWLDEPFADPSFIPTWRLCELTKKFVTVALSGDGVDELYGGYRRYWAMNLAQKLKHVPKSLRDGAIAILIKTLGEGSGYYGSDRIKQARLLLNLLSKHEQAPGDPGPQTFIPSERRKLLTSTASDAYDFDLVTQLNLGNHDVVTQMLRADLQAYLAENILTKVDRASMRHSLEVRSPFLDYRMVELACKIPTEMKIKNGEQKSIFKLAFSRQLPDYVVRRKKHGFAVPLADWFRNDLKTIFEERVFDANWYAQLNRDEVVRLWREHQAGKIDHGFKLWSLLVFCSWYNRQGQVI